MSPDIWRNFINKPKLGCSISNIAEAGYSHYGPSFSIAGTLTANNGVILVHNICVNITCVSDNENHFLDWFSFRPHGYTMGRFSDIDMEMASRFTISTGQTHNHKTLFIDHNRFAEMKSVLTVIKETWIEYLKKSPSLPGSSGPDQLFKEFRALKIIEDAAERIRRMNYWLPGDYLAKIRVTTASPKQVFEFAKKFTLTQDDAKAMELNTLSILGNICNVSHAGYGCATPILFDPK